MAFIIPCADGELRYALSYRGEPILADSALGIALVDAPPLEDGFRVTASWGEHHGSTWLPVYGERSLVRDRYNELANTTKVIAGLHLTC